MGKRTSLTVALAMLVGVGGCDTATSIAPSDLAEDAAAAGPAALQADATELTRGLAGALREEPVRQAVLQAMRGSPFNEHKLDLVGFLESADGAVVREAVARSLGVSGDHLGAMTSRLPAFDFYVPSREDRLTWRGDDEVAVAYVLEADATEAQAYDPSGLSFTVSAGDELAHTLLLLEPADFKTHRYPRQAASRGDVIQDAGDADGGVWVSFVADGQLVEVDVSKAIAEAVEAGVLQDCEDRLDVGGLAFTLPDCGGGGGGGGGNTETYNDSFTVFFSDGFGSNEVEMRSRGVVNSNYVTSEYVLRRTGINPYVSYYTGAVALPNWYPEQSGWEVWVELWETDLVGDDYYGTQSWAYGQNDQTFNWVYFFTSYGFGRFFWQ